MAPTRETYYWVTRTPLFQDEVMCAEKTGGFNLVN